MEPLKKPNIPRHPKATPLKFSKGIIFGPNKRTRRGALRPNNTKKISNTFYKRNRPTTRRNRNKSRTLQKYRLEQQSVFPNTINGSSVTAINSQSSLNIPKLKRIISEGLPQNIVSTLSPDELDWIIENM